jgi:D-alanyl-D-alanine carboxypeptidase/D-alanyl-D-alanine-endopeptidase (penicillin-binding protein 4)
MRVRLAIFGLLLVTLRCASAQELPEPVAAQLKAAEIPRDAIAVLVRRLSDGADIVSHRANMPMQPASTLKLLTALAALETLGPAYRGRSELRSRGDAVDGVLVDDLVLRGLGDVDLDWQALQRMLQSLRLRGIREIRGDLVLDRALFRPARTDLGVPDFDESPEFRYNVIPDALLLNTNLLQLDLASGADEVRVLLATPLDRVVVSSELEMVERACEDWEDGWKTPVVSEEAGGVLRIVLRGEYPKNCTASTEISVLDRTDFADRMFRALWTRMGGAFRGATREGEAPGETRLLAEHRSRPFSEVVRDIDKRSDNPIARVAYLTLGALSSSDADKPTRERAEAEVKAWMKRRDIDSTGLTLENGSGLSRTERIRPTQLAAVLQAASASPWAPEFLASLPIVAVDGGMRTRLRESPAAGRARIKTGTLRDVSAIAGYVKNEAGETFVVVAMVNHELANRKVARPILDALIDWVAHWRAPPA